MVFFGIIFIVNKKILKKHKVHLRGEDEGGGGGGEILAGRCRLKMMMINFLYFMYFIYLFIDNII